MRRGALHIMFRVVDNVRQKHLDWVNSILASRGWKQHRLAKEAGLSPSALNKFINDPTGTRTLNSYSIEKIESATGVPLTVRGAPVDRREHSESGEIAPVASGSELIAAAKHGKNGVDAFEMKARVLELAGYIPGDVLVVDENATPQPGDVVLAEHFDRNGQSEMIVRIYETSFLVAATMDPAYLSPILINKDVHVRGVVIASIRKRRAA